MCLLFSVCCGFCGVGLLGLYLRCLVGVFIVVYSHTWGFLTAFGWLGLGWLLTAD